MSQGTREPQRRVVERSALELKEHILEDLRLDGCIYGRELGSAPIYLVVGGISATPRPFGTDEEPGWWQSLARPDLIDLDRHTVLCPALPGRGTEWKALRAAEADPLSHLERLSVNELADLIAVWLEAIGCSQPVRYMGASIGGLVGLALAVRHPHRVEQLVTISAGLRPDGWGTGVRHLQREIVREGLREGSEKATARALSHARQLGMLTYRGRGELNTRFGPMEPNAAVPPIASYLSHHGTRYAESASPHAFLLLSDAIDRFRLAHSEEEERALLRRIQASVTVVGVPDDMLFPYALQSQLHIRLGEEGVESRFVTLNSVYGHDAFLADQAALAELLVQSGVGSHSRPMVEAVSATSNEQLRRVRVGLIGCGEVGAALLRLLSVQRDEVIGRYGVVFDVVRIAVRNLEKDRGALPVSDDVVWTDDPLSLVRDPAVDVVVEVAGGLAMSPMVRAALELHKPVVTANKALVAAELGQLAALANATRTPLACEAATAAALPVLRTLGSRVDTIRGVWGIVNGTCNYALTRLEEDEWTLEESLKKAFELGFAEADPSADVEGHDAASKLSILAYRAFGAWILPDAFTVRGISELEPVDADLASAMGYRIRLLAYAKHVEQGLSMAVEPMLLDSWHLLASVEENYNAVYLSCEAAGDLSFFGQGAGGPPTATALAADLVDLACDASPRWPMPRPIPALDAAKQPRRHFMRVTAQRHPAIARRVEAHLRRMGLRIENRATRFDHEGERDLIQIGVITSACEQAALTALLPTLESLARVERVVILGVLDWG